MFGEILDVLAALEIPGSDGESRLWPAAAQFLYFAAIIFVAAWLQTTAWMLSGERQTQRIRQAYVRSVLRQEVAWFDAEGANEIYTRISGDLVLFYFVVIVVQCCSVNL